MNLDQAASKRRERKEAVAINAKVPRKLKADADKAVKVLGLKYVDIFVFALELVIARAAEMKRK